MKHDDFSLLMDEWMGPMLWFLAPLSIQMSPRNPVLSAVSFCFSRGNPLFHSTRPRTLTVRIWFVLAFGRYDKEKAITFTDNHDTAGNHHFEISDVFGAAFYPSPLHYLLSFLFLVHPVVFLRVSLFGLPPCLPPSARHAASSCHHQTDTVDAWTLVRLAGTANQIAAGYAMILSHPSRPCIFWQVSA